jgi:hypothetical protein
MTEPKAAKPKTPAPAAADPEPGLPPAAGPVLGRASESGDPAVQWLLARRETATRPGSGLAATVEGIDAELAGYGVAV